MAEFFCFLESLQMKAVLHCFLSSMSSPTRLTRHRTQCAIVAITCEPQNQQATCLIFHTIITIQGARGSVVGLGTTLQAGRSRDRIPDEVDFFNLPNPSSRTMALGSTQPMSTRNIPGGERRPARKADNLTAICEPIVYKKCGSLNISQPYGSPRPVTGIALAYLPITACNIDSLALNPLKSEVDLSNIWNAVPVSQK
jgi:hypothetical protein